MSATAVTSLALSAKDLAEILSISTRHAWSLHAATLGPAPISLGDRLAR